MNRIEFRTSFGTRGRVVLPVIHVLDTQRTLTNIDILTAEGAPGCFLINHDFGVEQFLPVVREVRAARPDLWMGVNFLAVTGLYAFPKLSELEGEGCRVDAYWADDARIDEQSQLHDQAEAKAIEDARGVWSGLYFGGTAFKKQRPVAEADYARSAEIASNWMDVVCTSGQATGVAAEDIKIATFRGAIGETALALASGITPENAYRYASVDAFMVATGINYEGNFYDIDPTRLRHLLKVTERMGEV
ncbi:MAG: adenine phosphoribosyltransferase [Pseudomonadota bacterium]